MTEWLINAIVSFHHDVIVRSILKLYFELKVALKKKSSFPEVLTSEKDRWQLNFLPSSACLNASIWRSFDENYKPHFLYVDALD